MTQSAVYDLIRTRGEISVAELCRLGPMSESTARRVIARLAAEGKIERYHGGAKYVFGSEPLISARARLLGDEKEAIANAACKMVSCAEPVMLLNGSTVNLMANHLVNISGQTIITNSIPVLNRLVESGNKLIMLGGVVNSHELSLTGSLNEICLRELRIGILFFSVFGIDLEFGITGPDLDQVQLLRSLFACSQKRVLLADHTKFKQTGPCLLGPIGCADMIITDAGIDSDVLAKLQQKGIAVQIADRYV